MWGKSTGPEHLLTAAPESILLSTGPESLPPGPGGVLAAGPALTPARLNGERHLSPFSSSDLKDNSSSCRRLSYLLFL